MRASSFTVLVAWLSVAGLVPSLCAAAPRNHVRSVESFDMLQRATQRQHKLIVLMHDGSDASVKAFQPWLFALAQLLPHFAVTTFDFSREKELVQRAFSVTKAPAIKLLARDNPQGQRVIDYKGPLEFEALLGWAKAAVNGEPHKLSAFGFEPPETLNPVKQGSKGSSSSGRSGAKSGGVMGGLNNLPESVRHMANTMVRERRLQRLLREYGDDRVAQYNAEVSQRYQQIVSEEKIDLSDKFNVQEANRRARDLVREEILAEAPDHVRHEVEADVQMGDMRKKDEL